MAPWSLSVCHGRGINWWWSQAEAFAEPQSKAKFRLQTWSNAAWDSDRVQREEGLKVMVSLKKTGGLGIVSCIHGSGGSEIGSHGGSRLKKKKKKCPMSARRVEWHRTRAEKIMSDRGQFYRRCRHGRRTKGPRCVTQRHGGGGKERGVLIRPDQPPTPRSCRGRFPRTTYGRRGNMQPNRRKKEKIRE